MSARRGEPFVAVLERRGRFLIAEPLFATPRAGTDGGRRPGARGVTVGSARSLDADGARVRAGDLVLVHVPSRGGAARVARRLGRPQVARDVIEALLYDRGMRRGFPSEAESEARAAGARVRADAGARRDLRELPTFTIDPASARDFDDAISAQAIDGGAQERAVRVWVHIADVSAHVRDGSALDREARRRATSVYAPGTVEPMLPHALSSDACSLREGEDRAAVTVELELRGARVASAAFYRSLIRSDARLDYERVDRIFAGLERAAEPWGGALLAARTVAAALERRRRDAGALVVDSPEPEFSFDEHGNVAAVLVRVQTESHRLIEHLMIAANEAVATLLSQRRVPCLYRVHEAPEPQRVAWLVEQLASLDVATPPLPERMSATQAAELVGEISRRVEQHIGRTGRGRRALGTLVLRSLMQAYYSPANLGHAGLRSRAYCHFTSPIRRYPDLVCHRALLSAVGAGEHAPRAQELAELGTWSSEREREAMLVERDSDDVARCFALEDHLREHGREQSFAGEVVGLIAAGAFVAFEPNGPRAGRARENAGARAEGTLAPAAAFEGMLPVRLMRAPRASAQGAGDRAGRAEARSRGERPGRGGSRAQTGRGADEVRRDWWELNEQQTLLRAQGSGATVRLGDPIRVRVGGVDAIRGRVDLLPDG